MILICPQCSTRYRTDAAKFPAEGRDVRCAKCGNVWHQMPEPDENDAPVAPPPEQPEVEEPVRTEPVPVIREPERPSFVPDAVSEDIAAPAEAPAKKSRAGMLAGWLLFFIVLGSIATAVVFFRQQIVSLWPQSATFYSTVGLDTNTRGIQFEDVSYVFGKDVNQTVLIITGKLHNITDQERVVPQLRVGLSDSSNREIYHWTFSADVTTLKPGQTIVFRTRLNSPPPAAHKIDVTPAKEGE